MRRGVKNTQGSKGAIRIISGQWRGRKLPVLDAEGLRPTTDRTKETLFNWLMSSIRDSRCLDLFAGSGSLGFEALSRYASEVTFVEKRKDASHSLKQNLIRLNITSENATVLCGDAYEALGRFNAPFNLIFLDPPFQQNLLPKVIPLIDANELVCENGLVYVECELENADYTVPETWNCIKDRQTKQVSYRLYQVEGK